MHASTFPSKNTTMNVIVLDQPVHDHREELQQEHDDERQGDIVALNVRCHSLNILILDPNLRESSNNTRDDFIDVSIYIYIRYASIFRVDAEIRNAFQTCICSAASSQTRRLLLKIGRFLPKIGWFLLKMQKASSEECWLSYVPKFLKNSAVSLMDLPELC